MPREEGEVQVVVKNTGGPPPPPPQATGVTPLSYVDENCPTSPTAPPSGELISPGRLQGISFGGLRGQASAMEDWLNRLDFIMKSYQSQGQFNRDETITTFFRYYCNLKAEQPSSLLVIPPKVRGLLESTSKLDLDFQDQVFMYKLQRGIVDDGFYIGPRMIANMIIETDMKQAFRWCWKNKSSIRSISFMSGFVLLIGAFLQIWVDFSKARVWRALMMELVCCLAIVVLLVEARTLFLETFVRKPLEANAFWLGKAQWRALFYLCIVFFTSEYWAVWRAIHAGESYAKEIPVLVGGFCMLCSSLCLLLTRRNLTGKNNVARRQIGDYSRLEELFEQFDEDRDSLLDAREITALFEHLGVKLWGWQKELLMLEYDTQILGGLRLEDFTTWFSDDD